MAGRGFMGLDIGTQSVKCVICIEGDTCERIFTGQSHALTVHTSHDISGSAEQNPMDWLTAIKEAVFDATKHDQSICELVCGVGVSGQQHGLVCLGADGKIVRPCMLWCDTRCSEEATQISHFLNQHIPAGYTSPKIMWMVKNEPELFESSAQFMLPHDFINFYLQGGLLPATSTVIPFVMECGDASGTGLFHHETKSLDRRVMDFIHPDLHRKLPGSDLCAPNACIGHVHPQVLQDLFGWETPRPGVGPVILSAGSGDNALALLGATSLLPLDPPSGHEESTRHPDSKAYTSPSPLLISLGTSGTIMQSWEHRPEDPQGVVSSFCDATGRWMPLVCVQNCTKVPDEIFEAYCPETTSRAEIELAAAVEEPGCEGVMILPYFSAGGERTPDWPHATGCLLGLKHGQLQRPALLYRAALEGVTCALLRGYRCMQQMPGSVGAQSVRVVGGGAQSELWLQIIADLFELPVTTLPVALSGHIGAIGAAAQCMAVFREEDVGAVRIRIHSEDLGAGNCCMSCQPNLASAKRKSRYQELYEKHVRISDAIFSKMRVV